MNKYKFFLLFIASLSSVAENFIVPSEEQHQPHVEVHHTRVSPGVHQLELNLEYVKSIGNDTFSYFILVGSKNKVRRISLERYFSTIEWEQNENYKLVTILLRNILVEDGPVFVQYVLEIDSVNRTNPHITTASKILPIFTPVENTYFWQERTPDLQTEIDQSFERLIIPQAGFGSAKDGYPCNGASSYSLRYSLNSFSTNDIIAKELAGKDPKTFRILELGTANAEFLLSAHQNFGLDFNQLTGISALDYRRESSLVPDSSYILHNIERLDLLFSKIERVDLIISQMTWLYLIDPLSALAMAYHILKDNGIMYIQLTSRDLSWQGVDIIELVEGLKSLGFEASVMWGETFCEGSDVEDKEAWFVLRKSIDKPILKLPYRIARLTTAGSEFLWPRAFYLPASLAKPASENKKRKLGE